ncbi:hypothetical protein DM02DRAFT_668950 [Periconia macrospinosa]|uniref:Uncharacterized protein n=1 Tax=Periconia macrospinosa TaxID=97972 RepID=A0A2V1E2I4_9PLEO|nr:hypothetical protein DM02DRAFT_668950 [Periconia macrospinosa]
MPPPPLYPTKKPRLNPPPIHPQPSSPLLRLPAEIRNRIYTLVLHHPSNIRIRFTTPVYWRYGILPNGLKYILRTDAPRNSLSLLATCRQIHAEANLLPFSLNVFDINERAIEPLTNCLPLHQRAALTTVYAPICLEASEMDVYPSSPYSHISPTDLTSNHRKIPFHIRNFTRRLCTSFPGLRTIILKRYVILNDGRNGEEALVRDHHEEMGTWMSREVFGEEEEFTFEVVWEKVTVCGLSMYEGVGSRGPAAHVMLLKPELGAEECGCFECL